MMTKITGQLVRVSEEDLRLAVGPFEYQLLVPDIVRRAVQTRVGEELSFHVIEYFEGNSNGSRFIPRRLGFLTETDCEFFELLCTVDKIGAKKALKAIARPTEEIAAAIHRQDVRWLSTLPGIGIATAEQIVSALKKKVSPRITSQHRHLQSDSTTATTQQNSRKQLPDSNSERTESMADGHPKTPASNLTDDVYAALIALGLTPTEARSKLDALLTSRQPFQSVEEALLITYSRDRL